jgi:hypothetical protein
VTTLSHNILPGCQLQPECRALECAQRHQFQ